MNNDDGETKWDEGYQPKYGFWYHSLFRHLLKFAINQNQPKFGR